MRAVGYRLSQPAARAGGRHRWPGPALRYDPLDCYGAAQQADDAELTMYAILSTSGRQYRIEPGTVLELDRFTGGVGDTVTLENSVLLVQSDAGTAVGTPHVEGAAVDLEIQEHGRGKKVVVFKMKRRKRSRSKHGHRQHLTRALVRAIRVPGQDPFEFVGEPAPEAKVVEPEPGTPDAAEDADAVSEAATSGETPEETAAAVEAATPAAEDGKAAAADTEASVEADTDEDSAGETPEAGTDEDDDGEVEAKEG